MKSFYLTISPDNQIKGEKLLLQALRSNRPGFYRLDQYSLNKRSNQQNRYVHVCFTLAQKGLYDAGYDKVTTSQAAKDWYKNHFLKIEAVNEKTAEQYDYIRHTSELSKEEMGEFIDRVRDYALEFTGVYIPTPDEYLQNIERYDLVALAT